ncbi:unnamed protein product [Medioppia subpectinata]|uniref:Uncharacterized protein n=1 Tax=Medioppia subpectinata TaxID=1979941 RepID=A0A7R9L0T3_9ACAR|nr:unnamed protein product [Medioppia subpectinata]CAG2113355.1 unnamed protein product [Medioppia subpectinata]
MSYKSMKVFTQKILPRLLELMPNASAIIVLQNILFSEVVGNKSKLVESALMAELIPKLSAIYKESDDLKTRQLMLNIYYTDVDNVLIQDSLQLIQCLVYSSPHFETTIQVFPLLRQLIQDKQTDPEVISESLWTVFVCNERFSKWRQLMVTSKVLKHIIQHWIDFKNSDAIVKPAFGIIAGLMARHPNYKKHLLAANNELLSGLSILANHNDLNKFYAMSVIQLASMRAIENRFQDVVQHIQQLIDGKAIEMCVQSLQTESSMKVKKSALNAIIVAIYKASDDQRDSIGRAINMVHCKHGLKLCRDCLIGAFIALYNKDTDNGQTCGESRVGREPMILRDNKYPTYVNIKLNQHDL